MVDIKYLESLLELLSDSKVKTFRSSELSLEFHVEHNFPVKDFTGNQDTTDHVVNVPVDEASLPPDLRTDNINSMDTIMNWSSGGDLKEEPIPGTDDHPLSEPSERMFE